MIHTVHTPCSHRAYIACAKPSFYSLAPNAASVRSNQGKTHAIHTWLSTAEGRENKTTTSETSLEVNTDLNRAHIACAKLTFYSLAPNAPSVWSN